MDQTVDHCVREYFKTHTVYGHGHDDVLGFNEDVCGGDLGIGIESFLETQTCRQKLESRAWYDVIQPSEILRYTNVQSDPDRDDAFLQSIMWC